jgi:hypothetical protein
MPTSAVEQYRRWYEYEKDSHRKVLDSLRAVPEGKRGSPEFAKAASLMAHIVAARRLWMFRFGLTPEPAHEFFPQNVRMEDLERDVEEMQQVWSAYYARLQEGVFRGSSSTKAPMPDGFATLLRTSSRSCSATPGTTADRSRRWYARWARNPRSPILSTGRGNPSRISERVWRRQRLRPATVYCTRGRFSRLPVEGSTRASTALTISSGLMDLSKISEMPLLMAA